MITFSYVLRHGVDRERFIARFVIPFEQRLDGLSPDERAVVDSPCPLHASAFSLWLQGSYQIDGLAELWRN